MRFFRISGGFRVKRFQTIEAIPKRTKSFFREDIPYITENISIDIFAATFVRYLLLFSVSYLQLSCAALSWATDDTMEKTQEILRHLQFIRYIPDH